MNELKISYVLKSEINIYKHPIVKDIISYIKSSMSDLNMPLVHNKELLNIINKPYRYIGSQVIADNKHGIGELKQMYSKSELVSRNIDDLMFHMRMIAGLNPYAAINYVRHGAGYDAYMKEQAHKKGVKYNEQECIYNEVWNKAAEFENLRDWVDYAERMSERNIENNGNGEGVNIITMHASKGLEYKAVFIPDANQGVIPETRAIREYDVEEERRVFYVALTRASEYLHVTFADNVMGRKCQVSQFVQEMCECLQF